MDEPYRNLILDGKGRTIVVRETLTGKNTQTRLAHTRARDREEFPIGPFRVGYPAGFARVGPVAVGTPATTVVSVIPVYSIDIGKVDSPMVILTG